MKIRKQYTYAKPKYSNNSFRELLSTKLLVLSKGKSKGVVKNQTVNVKLNQVEQALKGSKNKAFILENLALLTADHQLPLFIEKKIFTNLKALGDTVVERNIMGIYADDYSRSKKDKHLLYYLIKDTLAQIKYHPESIFGWKIFLRILNSSENALKKLKFWDKYHTYYNNNIRVYEMLIRMELTDINIMDYILKKRPDISLTVKDVITEMIYELNIKSDFHKDVANQMLIFFETIIPLLNDKMGDHQVKTDDRELIDKYLRFFTLWQLNNQYPTYLLSEKIKKLFHDIEQVEKQAAYQTFAALPFKKVIQYLPEFVLTDILQFPLNWLIHLGAGLNVRKMKASFPFSKKMAHIFHNLKKEEIGLNGKYIYSLAKSYGFSHDFVVSICQYFHVNFLEKYYNHRRSMSPEEVELLNRILEKLAAWNIEANVATVEHRTILGYISHIVRDEPDFKIKGRSLASFRRLSDAYYIEQRNNELGSKFINSNWQGAPYEEWTLTQKDKSYTITQLNTGRELFDEGQLMYHCVATYIQSCLKKSCSIWSLRITSDEMKNKPLVTIELNNNGQIMQAKEKYNQKPSSFHLNMIKNWAKKEGLTIVNT